MGFDIYHNGVWYDRSGVASDGGVRRKPSGISSIGLPAGAPASANQTWHNTRVAARPYHAVELFFASTNATYGVYDDIAVAPSANLAGVATPTGPWTVCPSVTVALTGTADNPALASTGKVACRSVPRNDGGKYPLFMNRVHTALAIPCYAGWGNFVAGWDTNNPDWIIDCYSQTGNYASTNQAGFTSTTKNSVLVPAAVKFYYDTAGLTILGIGDSLMGGDSIVDGSPQRMSYGYKAVRTLQDQGFPFDFVNSGISGNSWALYSVRGKALIDLFKPDICLIPTYTPNDAASTQAAIDTQWDNCMDLVQYAIAAGVLPVLIGPLPLNSLDATQDGYRLQNRARMIASGYYYFDVEPIVSTQTTPARWIPGMNDAGNNTHYGAAGGSALGAGLVQVLKQLL